MNHTDIEEHQIIDLYLMGKLPAEEAARFEEHYLSCPECLDRLEEAESMQRGFKRAAGQDAARLAATRQLALLAWLTRLGRSRQMAFLLLALFAVAALPGGLAFRKIEDKNRELEGTRQALKKAQERAQVADQALKKERGRSQAAGSQTAEAEKLRKELEASRSELARERETSTGLAEQLEQALRPQANIAILALGIERSAGPADKPTASYVLPKTPQSIVIYLTIDATGHPAYRVVLRAPQGKELWRGTDFHEMDGLLTLSLPSTMLKPGDYTLTAEGITPGGKPVPAGRFTFRVLPPA